LKELYPHPGPDSIVGVQNKTFPLRDTGKGVKQKQGNANFYKFYFENTEQIPIFYT